MIVGNELNSIPELKTFKNTMNLPMNFKDHGPKDHGLI